MTSKQGRHTAFLTKAAAAAVLAAGSAASLAADPPKPLKINYGAPTADYYTLYVAKDHGLFEKHGLEPNFFWFASGAPLLAGLKSESLDVFTTGLASAFALGQNLPVKLLFWQLDDAPGQGLVVSKDSGIDSYRDLKKAKAIGTPSGTCAQVALGLMARKAGIAMKELNVVNIAPPLYANAFTSNSIDAGVTWAPYLQSVAERGYKIVNYDTDYDGICPVMTGARTKFLQEHPDVGLKLVQISAEAQRMVADNPQLAIDVLEKYLKVSPAVAKATYERLCCGNFPTFRQQADPESPYSLVSDKGIVAKLHTATQILAEAGTIPQAISRETVAASIDASYVRQYLATQPGQ
ncbi:ABC transporter substrate-binding protein [Bordetella bronchiseptica]|uniref:Exported protein n=1 Tax=Bordetella bronchiseptica (strain ATCC BAA-588 / NCTC 13252 / RB50) TaxID=257310 RepID=A0A0H3LQP7_BORBR|nr:ABC transporter substrate-binding protein [Bordetella bronchiseptica]KAK61144.1 NMT1/THI5-like protein [Bordetella bronchiseptica 980-2]AMG90301.1 taurine ABC transporter substrate-binding protein [Bordetella bronchiseptica]AWP81663.1 taurine ABC transporter substrate-binding protein [Bordetella bronchiseptica]AWP86455.1 taurine ABC transporter substrate-binding protein [Bordetella bronchiseptica]AWQ12026.1 taurine ABC transporter substrate-binding protein [Bordetella bronchiseptica]